MPSVAFDRYYRYADLTAILNAFAAENPKIVSIESIGKSYEGRDIWVLTVTNRATGPAAEKPAYWVDGNIHATEVAGSTANLYFLQMLVTQYGKDPDVTRALDTRAFYICPRINPDGAEWALADKPKFIRSSTRPYPYDEDEIEGLTVEDIDGDGRVLQMRMADPNGLWKDHPQQPGLMVRRDPIETGGTYYHILPEGSVEDWDGYTIRVKKTKEGLDLNRNFPASWRQEFEQLGAGPYPASEPEVRALVAFITTHTNITGATTFHTWAGVLLRPFEHQSDDEMHAEDLWFYKKVGEKGLEMTGYPAISVFHDFRYHPKSVIAGTFDWLYEHLGMYTWVVEIWSPMREAGIEKYHHIDWFRDHPIDDDLKIYSVEPGQAGRRRARRVEAVRSSAARQDRDRRLGQLQRVRESAAGAARARGRALPQVDAMAGADVAEAGARGRGGGCAGRRHLACPARRPEHRMAAELRVEARARPQGRARRGGRDRVAGRGESPARQAADGGGPARRQGIQAHGHFVLGRQQRHRRPGEDRVGGAGEKGRAHRARRTAREGRRRARGSHAELIFSRDAMATVRGVGGIFFTSPDPACLRAGYAIAKGQG